MFIVHYYSYSQTHFPHLQWLLKKITRISIKRNVLQKLTWTQNNCISFRKYQCDYTCTSARHFRSSGKLENVLANAQMSRSFLIRISTAKLRFTIYFSRYSYLLFLVPFRFFLLLSTSKVEKSYIDSGERRLLLFENFKSESYGKNLQWNLSTFKVHDATIPFLNAWNIRTAACSYLPPVHLAHEWSSLYLLGP